VFYLNDMPNVLLDSKRSFVVFSYDHGHGLMLLRSRKTPDNPTRMDVLFQDVRAIESRMWFEGIRIEESDLQAIAEFQSNPCELIEPGLRVYLLRGSNWSGYVLAGC